MNYYATGWGAIVLQNKKHSGYKEIAAALNVPVEDVQNAIMGKINEVFETYVSPSRIFDDQRASAENGLYRIDVCFPYDHYDEDRVTNIFDFLSPVLAAGTKIEFTGEDETYWSFRSTSDGMYANVNGYIAYDGTECMSETCAFADKGKCHCHLVHGRYPVIGEEFDTGCSEYVFDPKKEVV